MSANRGRRLSITLPDTTYVGIERFAAMHGRSLSGQIASMLRYALQYEAHMQEARDEEVKRLAQLEVRSVE